MENPEIWHSLKESGNRHVKEGRFTEAIIEYTKAIRIDPNQPVLYSNRAIAELRLKMYKEAREDAENAIEKSNSSSSAESRIKYYRLLSEALIGLDLLDDAFSACLKGLQLDSRDEVLLLRKRNINSLMIKKQTDENPREDPKALIPRVEKDITFALNFMEQYQRLKPANEDVLDLDWNKYNQNMRLTSRLKEAHEWMNGINGKRVDKRKALRIFEETANRGSAEGLYNVGLCFSEGYGSDVVDYSKAIEFYRKAASQKPFFRFKGELIPNLGVAEAENSLGIAYRNGNGVDVDQSKAYGHFLRAAHLGQPDAQNNVGCQFLRGLGVEKNYELARQWFKRAAEEGLAEAQFNYAEMLEFGKGGQIDEKGALDYYQKASLQGLPNALPSFQRLTKTINDRKMSKKFELTLKIAEIKKDPNALFLLGENYFKDDNKKDLELAYKYLKEASDLNHLEATYLLSDLLLNTLRRAKEGFEYCLKASERGHISASRDLIDLYAFGHGCERDEAKARRIASRVTLRDEFNHDSNDKHIGIVKNIDETIKIGKEVCEFEEKEEFVTKSALNLTERLSMYILNKEKFVNRLYNKQFGSILYWVPEVVNRAKKGSITASRMIDGVNKGLKAIELIWKNEPEKAIKLIKQSFIECDTGLFTRLFHDEINEAVEKCHRNDSEAMFVKALLYHNNIEECILYLKRCLKTHPNDAHLHYFLSSMFGYNYNYSEANKEIDRALELDSSDSRWYYYRAVCRRFGMKEKIDEAIECYRKYLELNPDDDRKVPEAYYSMALLYARKNDLKSVKMCWDRANEAEKIRLACFEPLTIDEFPPKRAVMLYLMNAFPHCFI